VEEKYDVIAALKGLGISDPRNLSAADMKLLLDAFLKKKSLDNDAFKAITASITPTLGVLFEGLKAFSKDQADVAKGTIATIQQAISILERELAREKLTPEERTLLLNKVYDLVLEARKEAAENRNFLLKLAAIGGSVALSTIGVALYALSGGKNGDALAASGELLKKATRKQRKQRRRI
jgi:hypothetical protein